MENGCDAYACTKTQIKRVDIVHAFSDGIDTGVCNSLAITQMQVRKIRHVLRQAQLEQ
jgi:hypothetical protein